MRQGTKSVLFGCHSPVHSVLVVIAYRKLNGEWPKWKQLVCIFLHDIGHWGKNYLSNYQEKKTHWKLGAKVALKWFGPPGFFWTAGHDINSGYPMSTLYKADKYSWYIAPTWWLWWNNFVEPELTVNCAGKVDAVRKFQAMVKKSIESGEYRPTHDMYLERQARS